MIDLRPLAGSIQSRIDALSLRERGILFLVVALVLYLFWSSLLMGPLEQQQKALLSQINATRSEIAALDQQSLGIIDRHQLDPNAEERKQLAQLAQATDEIEQQLKAAISGLIEPQQMAQVLETVLARQKALRFLRIENLGAEPLLPTPVDAGLPSPSPGGAGIYKHAMRLEMEGDFAGTLRYLQALEQLPWQFRWDEVELTMLEYPKARVVVTVHTLSLQEGWLGV